MEILTESEPEQLIVEKLPWHKRNPEKHRENCRRWRQANKEKHKTYCDNWKGNNHDKYNEYHKIKQRDYDKRQRIKKQSTKQLDEQ